MRKSVTNFYDVDDVKKMMKDVLRDENVATKDDLKGFATKDELVSFKDEILHEIKAMRDENTLLTGYKDQIENHDVRIEHIEKHLHLAQPD